MPDRTFLDWPFFEDGHRDLAQGLEAWAAQCLGGAHRHDANDPTAADDDCRALVRDLGRDGWLAHAVPSAANGHALDARSLCLIRETLARHDGLADFAFAMQGLGSGPISLFGTDAQKAAHLPAVAAGEAIAAFALSEPEAGSDVAALACAARRDGGDYVLDGEKTWISNGGIADFYVVFARTEDPADAPGHRGLSAFIVSADTPGLSVAERIPVTAPHPLARLRFDGCRVPAAAMLGQPGRGFAIAMATLDVFRATVGAAALGFARRALDESLRHAAGRKLFGAPLADLQMTQAALADSATAVDAAALLVYRAAWRRDMNPDVRATRESSMAKLFATEEAQRVVDRGAQLFGGHGVTVGGVMERLYREVRSLRIYEGASEIQKVVIARQALRDITP